MYAHDCTACLMIRDQRRRIGEVIGKRPPMRQRVEVQGQTVWVFFPGRYFPGLDFCCTPTGDSWDDYGTSQPGFSHDYETHHWKKIRLLIMSGVGVETTKQRPAQNVNEHTVTTDRPQALRDESPWNPANLRLRPERWKVFKPLFKFRFFNLSCL